MNPGQCFTEVLSKREEEVLKMIGDGCTSKEIAAHLNISKETVSGYRKQICRKLRRHSTAELVAYAVRYLQNYPPPHEGD